MSIVFNQTGILTGTDSGASSTVQTVRNVLAAAGLSAFTTGIQGRITVLFGTAQTTIAGVITDMFAGRGAPTGNAYSFANPPSRVTFGRANTINGAAAATVVSDWFPLPETYDNTKPFVISYAQAALTLHASAAAFANTSLNTKTGNDASTQTASGYTGSGAFLVFTAILEIDTLLGQSVM